MKLEFSLILFQSMDLVSHAASLLGQVKTDISSAAENADKTVNPFVLFLSSPINLFLVCAILFMFIVVRPQQRQMKQLQQSLKELKKNDRIVMASGIHGTVVQAVAGDDTVMIRIDESSGTRIKINRDAIAKIIAPENKG
ncbi:MAG: preprotein translocase subunit YajC [Planctomycetales bacterium]|nr:preprotein translocase subunit YajC [Planctomycetales bacterium]